MTKILEIYGDADYSVLSYEDALQDNKVNNIDLWNKSNQDHNKSQVFEEGDTYFEYKAYSFKDIDPLFINFVKNEICDYDYLKHHSFIVVEE